MIDSRTFDRVAQSAHFSWGMAVVAVPSMLHWNPEGWAVGFLIYAAIKEFWYDQVFESPEVRGSSLKDFIFQAAGVLFAAILKGWA